MRLSRTDLLPLLTIATGGVIGVSLSFGFLALAPSSVVPVLVVAPVPVVAPPAPAAVFFAPEQARVFDLQQNYPNPFSLDTTIPFVLHEELFEEGRTPRVSMRVFNVLQQPVASPVALDHSSGEAVELIQLEYTQPGEYRAFWDGTDQSGREVASGVYMMQLSVDGLPPQLVRLYRGS